MKISIQGNVGSYSHIAAHYFFPKQIQELFERDTFGEVFEDLKNGVCDFAVIPVENSTYGSVVQVFDLFAKYNFFALREVFLKINFHLISFPENELDDIKELYTHPVGMGQIKTFLAEHPKIKAIEYPDTAGSVKMIKEKNLRNASAAASALAAELYGMKILKENIHENKKNYTRFFLLSKNPDFVSETEKTTLLFTLGNESGSLYLLLKPFAENGISLSKIESRPILHTEWEYLFFVDVMDGINSKKMKDSIAEVKNVTKELRVIGSYSSGIYLDT